MRSGIFRPLSSTPSPPVLLAIGRELRPKGILMCSNVAAPFLGRERVTLFQTVCFPVLEYETLQAGWFPAPFWSASPPARGMRG